MAVVCHLVYVGGPCTNDYSSAPVKISSHFAVFLYCSRAPTTSLIFGDTYGIFSTDRLARRSTHLAYCIGHKPRKSITVASSSLLPLPPADARHYHHRLQLCIHGDNNLISK